MKVLFNKPYYSGNEINYINDAISRNHISGNGFYTHQCHSFFKEKYGFTNCLLTTSCTDALEMAAILLDLKKGDEVIMPSFTFVSTANAFALRGATIKFADSLEDHPNIDENKIESLINSNTKAIVVVHYAGMSCNMDVILDIANKYKLILIEDAAQAIDSYYLDRNGLKRPLGSIGHLATFSFHETKNIISGEGGLLVINDSKFVKRSNIIWEKGTNRIDYFNGLIDKYSWVDIGSSFLPSEIISAFLFSQLKSIKYIQEERIKLWDYYYMNLKKWAEEFGVILPKVKKYMTNNAHIFYLICKDRIQRDYIIEKLKCEDIISVFHYQGLHKSDFYLKDNNCVNLKNCDNYSDTLLRLPLYIGMDISRVVNVLKKL